MKKMLKKFGQYLVRKLQSRKVQIVILATILLIFDKISGVVWASLAGTYMVVNVVDKKCNGGTPLAFI